MDLSDEEINYKKKINSNKQKRYRFRNNQKMEIHNLYDKMNRKQYQNEIKNQLMNQYKPVIFCICFFFFF